MNSENAAAIAWWEKVKKMNIEGGWTYNEALEVIDDLRLNGFESGITVGGVWVNAKEGDPLVIAIAQKHDGGTSYGEPQQCGGLQQCGGVKNSDDEKLK